MQSPEANKQAVIKALLVAPFRALNLGPRMRKRFVDRGWEIDDRMHIAAAAVACVRIGLDAQRWRVPPGTNDAACWASVVGKSTSSEIVRALELEDMLFPEKIMSVVPK